MDDWMDGWTDGYMDGWTDSPCIPRDFFPLLGQSPAYFQGYHKQTAQQGIGTDDHLLPLGGCFFSFAFISF